MKKLNLNILISIKNAQIAKRSFIFYKKTKITSNLLRLLWCHGFIINYKIVGGMLTTNEKFKIFLKYTNNQPAISGIKLITSPGKKMQCSAIELSRINARFIVIISTNTGLTTLKRCKQTRIGGQPIALIF